MPTIDEIREEVIHAFNPDEACGYSAVKPFQYTGFIDGMAWVGMLCGASYLVNDKKLADLSECFINNLLLVGKDARTFAPSDKALDGWKSSKKMPGYSYKEKKQSMAGPIAALWAKKCGANIDFEDDSMYWKARLICMISPLYGSLLKKLDAMRQHVNTVFFCHLLLDKKPPKSLKYLTENNTVYSYIFKKHCGESIYRNTGPWPAKDLPDNPKEVKDKYVQTCSLTGIYLQRHLASK
jgi:hypothetical protein